MNKQVPKIGLLSGVGPLAGADVFMKIIQYSATKYNAVEDNEYPEIVVINHGIDGVDNTGAMNESFKKDVKDIVNKLEKNDANIIGMACNTAHIYLDDIKTKKQTNVINLIDTVAKEVAKNNKKYLLLTSKTSKEQKLYQNYLDKYNVNYKTITNNQQDKLDKAIEYVMGYNLKKAGNLLQEILDYAYKNGYEAIIAGCTELPIAIENTTNNYNLEIVSSNMILAKILADTYYSKS